MRKKKKYYSIKVIIENCQKVYRTKIDRKIFVLGEYTLEFMFFMLLVIKKKN